MPREVDTADSKASLFHMTKAWDVLDAFLERHAPEVVMRAEWRCLHTQDPCLRAGDDPVWEGRPFVELAGSSTAYIQLAATVDWDRGILHLTSQDWKTGAADKAWDVSLDPDWIGRLRAAKWPEPGERPWF